MEKNIKQIGEEEKKQTHKINRKQMQNKTQTNAKQMLKKIKKKQTNIIVLSRVGQLATFSNSSGFGDNDKTYAW